MHKKIETKYPSWWKQTQMVFLQNSRPKEEFENLVCLAEIHQAQDNSGWEARSHPPCTVYGEKPVYSQNLHLVSSLCKAYTETSIFDPKTNIVYCNIIWKVLFAVIPCIKCCPIRSWFLLSCQNVFKCWQGDCYSMSNFHKAAFVVFNARACFPFFV